MAIYKTAINKPITTGLIFVAVIVLGLFSLSRLPIDQMPEMDPPYVTVMTTYAGANASDIETNITKIVENSLNSVDGLKNITSTSKDNISVVTLEFEWGSNLDEALNDTAAEIRDGAFGFKLYAMNSAQKTAADSVKYLNDMKALMAQYPDNEKVFGALGDALLQRDMNDELVALCNAHPQNPLSIVYKGMIAMNAKKYTEAIADFSSITPDHPSYLQVVFNRAVCKLNVASDFQDTHANRNTGAMSPADDAKLKELLNDAKGDFEIARQLDPEQQTVRWAVLLRNIYYNLGEEEKYKELEFM